MVMEINESVVVYLTLIPLKVNSINALILIKASLQNFNFLRIKVVVRHIQMDQIAVLSESFLPFFCRFEIILEFLLLSGRKSVPQISSSDGLFLFPLLDGLPRSNLLLS